MRRLGRSDDSLGALMSICPTIEDRSPNGSNHVYGRDIQSMLEGGLDEEGCCLEESGQPSEKKRRLSVDQVRALEKNFEVENKLEPEKKVKLAQELGLQPRQVAVWFQNRRARWKTKQLERDYGVLKANFDALKQSYDNLRHENEALRSEIRELKSKLQGEDDESNVSVKEEAIVSDTDEKPKSQVNSAIKCDDDDDPAEFNYQSFSSNDEDNNGMVGPVLFPDLKDGPSDSDSSAILNEGNSSPAPLTVKFLPPPTLAATCYQFSHPKSVPGDDQKAYQPQFVKVEEHNFFGGDEPCNFFSEDQAPTLQWYCHDQWN